MITDLGNKDKCNCKLDFLAFGGPIKNVWPVTNTIMPWQEYNLAFFYIPVSGNNDFCHSHILLTKPFVIFSYKSAFQPSQ